MPWWSWLIIWSALGLALWLALSAWLLFCKFVDDLDQLSSKGDVPGGH